MPKDSSKVHDDLKAGLDEVGRGSWAGPLLVVVAAFYADTPKVQGVRDSKRLTAKKRQLLVPEIMKAAAAVGFGWSCAEEIDDVGINEAWQKACARALAAVPKLVVLYVDGDTRVENYSGKQEIIVRADSSIWQVSAASIVAKEARDLVMKDDSRRWPQYGWEKNSGYGTHQHQLAILEHGTSEMHRQTFLKKLNARLRMKLRELTTV